jgi:hypothetical protein
MINYFIDSTSLLITFRLLLEGSLLVLCFFFCERVRGLCFDLLLFTILPIVTPDLRVLDLLSFVILVLSNTRLVLLMLSVFSFLIGALSILAFTCLPIFLIMEVFLFVLSLRLFNRGLHLFRLLGK